MKILERLGVDEYYQTLSTWIRIADEKVSMSENFGNSDSEETTHPGRTRRRLGSQ